MVIHGYIYIYIYVYIHGVRAKPAKINSAGGGSYPTPNPQTLCMLLMLRRKWCMMITGVFVAQFGKTRVLEKPLGSLGSDWCSWLAYFSTSPQIQISGETPNRILGISMSWTFPWNHPVLGTASWTLKSYLGPKPGADGSGKTGLNFNLWLCREWCVILCRVQKSERHPGTLLEPWKLLLVCKVGLFGFQPKKGNDLYIIKKLPGDFDHVLFSSPFGMKICTDKRLWGSLRAAIFYAWSRRPSQPPDDIPGCHEIMLQIMVDFWGELHHSCFWTCLR